MVFETSLQYLFLSFCARTKKTYIFFHTSTHTIFPTDDPMSPAGPVTTHAFRSNWCPWQLPLAITCKNILAQLPMSEE